MKIKTTLTVEVHYRPEASNYPGGVIPSKEELLKECEQFAQKFPEEFMAIAVKVDATAVVVEE